MKTRAFQESGSGRPLLAVSTSSISELAAQFPSQPSRFILFIAADTSELPTEVIQEAAARLLAAGAVYVCCWGPDCERLHDHFDEEAIIKYGDGPGVIMTTWHSHDSLQDAVWFAVNSACADEAFQDGQGRVVFASVGPNTWASEVEKYLEAGCPMPDEA